MSRAATGDFGGARAPAPDGIVSFDVGRVEVGYVATGGEPTFDGEGYGPTAALAIGDYCEWYHDATVDRSEGQR